jgi:hypothetical protein
MPEPSTNKIHSHPASQSKADPRSSDHQDQSSSQQPATSVHPVEPEDKRAPGTSSPEQRDILGQNVEKGQAQQHPATPAGQHATGSFPTGNDKK